ncbi:MAG: aryl-sulfate sulfotransferase [Halobacteriales archaeon]
MWTPSRRGIRVALVALLVVQTAVLAVSYVEATSTDELLPAGSGNATPGGGTGSATGTPAIKGSINIQPTLDSGDVAETLSPNGQVTVIATQGFYVSDEEAELVAIDRRGEIIYYEDQYRVYYDVDPVPGADHTVEYVASKHFDGEDCSEFSSDQCTRNVLNRANLSTGEVETLYAKLTPRVASARWHDIDRINDTHIVLADIVRDSVRIIDTEDNETVAVWKAEETYDDDQGGSWADWTHVNDVEVLPDGRIMASIRNMDEVVFLERENGTLTANESWTLGEDENHDILYEQHNPDYIPASRGGPAVIVADSENERALEFHRENGSWERAWGWQDERVQWPRDADRLPSGLTLIVDSHGDRVLEVTPDGEPLWTVEIGMPYDVERLGTGDESAGGYAMGEIPPGRAYGPPANGGGTNTRDGTDVTGQIVRPDQGPIERGILALKDLIPSLWLNSALYVAPSWVRFTDLLFLFWTILTGVTLGASEFWHSRFSVRRGLRRVWSSARSRLPGRRN